MITLPTCDRVYCLSIFVTFVVYVRSSSKWLIALCLSLVMLHGAMACTKNYFSLKERNEALEKFFGNFRGSYLGQDQLLTAQMADLLEIDYTSIGNSISEMPPLGGETYLDVGVEWHSEYPNDAIALILTPCGQIRAAAIFWQRSVLPLDYRTGPVFLTIFVKQNLDLPQTKIQINILKNFGYSANQSYLGVAEFQQSIRRSRQWQTNSTPMAVPTNVVYLHDH
jgi:hypothetical protein